MKSILHIGNTAGIACALRDKQRAAGNKSEVISMFPQVYEYPVDRTLQTHGQRRIKSMWNLGKIVWGALNSDEVYYHSYLPFASLEMMLLKLKGVNITIYYHGSDIRDKGQPWVHQVCANRIYVSTPDLMQHCELGKWHPCPILEDESLLLRRKRYLETKDRRRAVRVLHTPTHKDIKGTKYIRQAVEQLKGEGWGIDYHEYSGIPHEEVLEKMAYTDIYIDQLLLGAYGVSAVECAYLSVPVICNYNPDYYAAEGVDNIPFYNANKHSIYGVLREVLSLSHDERLRIGQRCNEYYVETHAGAAI